MSSETIETNDIESYFPRWASPERREEIQNLTVEVLRAVHRQLPIGFCYNGTNRLVLPHSLYLQNTTPNRLVQLPRENHATRMKLSVKWARRTIAFDGYQTHSNDLKARDGWKSFHMDRVENIQLYTEEEVRNILGILDEEMFKNRFEPVGDFVGNWNFWFRDYLAQVPAKKDIREVIPGLKLMDTREEK